MEVSVQITRENVMQEVYKITGYTGKKNGDMDGLSSTEDDVNVLDIYYSEATSSLAEEISRMGYLSQEDGSTSSFQFTLPSNWNGNMKSSLVKSMEQYVCNYICAKWFNLMKKNETEHYSNLCTQLGASIQKFLLERKRPR